MSVAGKDTGWRKALSLQGEVEGIKPGMAVLYPGGLVGKIDPRHSRSSTMPTWSPFGTPLAIGLRNWGSASLTRPRW